MKMSLYEMTNDLVELMEIPEEELTEEEREEITNVITKMIKEKSTDIIKYLRNIETRVTALKEEEKRMKEYRQSEEKRYDRLKQYLVSCLIKSNLTKLDTNLGKISVRKAPASVVVNEEVLPKDYFKEEIVRKVDKKYIKQILMEGTHIDGAMLVEDKYTLTIK